jgi:hypothetical protein
MPPIDGLEVRVLGAVAVRAVLPSVLRAGWWWGTDRQDEGEFFRAEITDAGRGCCPSEPTSTAGHET